MDREISLMMILSLEGCNEGQGDGRSNLSMESNLKTGVRLTESYVKHRRWIDFALRNHYSSLPTTPPPK